MAKEAAAKAAKEQKEAEEAAANWKKQAKEAKAKAAKEMAAAEKLAKEEAEKLKKEQEAQAKKQAAALKKQAESLAKAAEAQAKADAAAKKAREQQEKKQLAYLKQQMAERKAKFSNSFSHTWSNGEPGVSYFELNMDLSAGQQDEVIAKLFKNRIVADLEVIPGSVQRFVYNDDGHMDSRIEFIKLVGIVNDDHIEEFRALASHFQSSSTHLQKSFAGLPSFDLITYPIGTGSKEYIEWALEQTTKTEDTPRFTASEKVEDKKPEGDAKVQIKESNKNNESEEEEEDDDDEEQEE